jgi:hypothetical protein
MRTTLNISDAILQELRALSESTRRPFREVLEDTIHRGLSRPESRRRKISISPHPVGVKPAFRGMSMNQLFDQIEAEGDGR